ncbi:hypothetical protein D3C84_773700 [compost metagenome]
MLEGRGLLGLLHGIHRIAAGAQGADHQPVTVQQVEGFEAQGRGVGALVADLVGRASQPHLGDHAAGEGAAVHVARPLGVPAHYAHLLPLMAGKPGAGLCQTGIVAREEGLGLGLLVHHIGAAVEHGFPGLAPVAGDDGGGYLLEQGQELWLGLAGEDEVGLQIDEFLQIGVVQIPDHLDLLARHVQQIAGQGGLAAAVDCADRLHPQGQGAVEIELAQHHDALGIIGDSVGLAVGIEHLAGAGLGLKADQTGQHERGGQGGEDLHGYILNG